VTGSNIRTMQSIIRYKQAYRTDYKKNMLDTYRIGKDGVKVTFPSKGYTYREGKDGRLIAFPSSGYTYREGSVGRVVAFPLSGYTYKENQSGRIIPEKI
jgi:hypothetical protein